MLGNTPIFDVARHGRPETARTLLAARANIKLRNNAGLTPLQVALQNRNEPVVKVLRNISNR